MTARSGAACLGFTLAGGVGASQRQAMRNTALSTAETDRDRAPTLENENNTDESADMKN